MSLLRSRKFWPGLAIPGLGIIVLAVACYGSWWLRQEFVEPSDVALVCNTAPHPSWCLIRFAILTGQHNALFGAAALVAGGLALFRGGPGPAIAAAGLGVVAIVNYNVEMGALALVFGLIASVRSRAAPSPRDGAPRA